MSGAEVRIATGSRLHLGMFGFGRPGERQFGGVGLMVAEPRLELRLSRAEQFAVTGVAADGEAATSFAATLAPAPPTARRWNVCAGWRGCGQRRISGTCRALGEK